MIWPALILIVCAFEKAVGKKIPAISIDKIIELLILE